MTTSMIIRIAISMAAAGATPDKIQAYIDSLTDDAALSATNIRAAAPAPAPAPKPAPKKFVVLFDGTVAPADAADFDTAAFRTR